MSDTSATPIPPSAPALAQRESPLTGLFLVLIVVCLALGATLSWALYERRERRELLGRLDLVSTRNGVVEAQAGQLRQFLAHPGTRLIHLRGINQAQGHSATIAWNAARREGVLLLDPADAAAYRLVARTPQGMVPLQDLDKPAPTAAPFTAPTTLPADMQFELRPPGGTAASYIEIQ
jgi:hypothetical protein